MLTMTIDNKVETAPMVCYRLSPIILQSCNACNCKETHYNFKNAIGRPLKLVLRWTQFPFPASGQIFLAVIKPSFAWKERRGTSALPSYLPCQPWRLDPTFVRDRIGTPRGTTRHEGRTRLRNKGQKNWRSTGMRRCAIKGAQAKRSLTLWVCDKTSLGPGQASEERVQARPDPGRTGASLPLPCAEAAAPVTV